MANETEFYMLGVNRYLPGEMSLLTIEKANLMSKDFLTGMLLTRSGSGPLSLRVCLVRQDPQKPVRQYLNDIGLMHESDVSIERAVLAALKGDLYLSAAG